MMAQGSYEKMDSVANARQAYGAITSKPLQEKRTKSYSRSRPNMVV